MKYIASILILVGCSAPDRSRQALEDEGYTDIEIHGWSPLTCGQDDKFSTAWTARNVRGRVVSGVVCCGLMAKRCTVRH